MVESTMPDDFDAAEKLINWNKRLLSVLGVWPHSRKDFKYFLAFGYYAAVIILEYADLFQDSSNLERLIWSLQECICFTQIMIKLVTLRYYNREFGDLLSALVLDFKGYNYIFPEERKAFMKYINMSRLFMAALMISVALVPPTYYLKPLVIQLKIGESVNVSNRYQLPYFVYLMFNVQSMQSYIIAYIIELPIPIISAFSHIATDVLMFTLVFYICGQLSVLAIRLRNLTENEYKTYYNIKMLVKHHIRLLRSGNSIKQAFNFVLLGHLVGAGILISLLSYQYLIDIATGQKTDLVFLILYEFLILFVLFTQCMVGECLYIESVNIHDAFYNCKWYDMPKADKTIIMFCIARSQKPLCLTAGQFGTFSLEMLTNVLKTAMAYLSLLRSVM